MNSTTNTEEVTTRTLPEEKRQLIPEGVDNPDQREKRPRLDISNSAVIPNFNSLKSKYYQLFTWNNNMKWECRLCEKTYSHSANGIAGLCQKHSKTHQIEIDAAGGIDAFIQKLNKGEMDGPPPAKAASARSTDVTEEGYQQHLVDLVVCANLPFTIVSEKAFIKYGSYISQGNPVCQNPSPPTLAKWVAEGFESKQAFVEQILKSNPGKISFILDCWTSKNQKAFQGVIACWINQNWVLCHTPVDLTILRGDHSGKNLAEAFSSVLDKYGLWKQLMSVTTDNATNMNSLLKEVSRKAADRYIEYDRAGYRVRCMAHILNLACQAIVKSVMGEVSYESTEEPAEDDAENDEEEHAYTDDRASKMSFLDKLRLAIKAIRGSPQRREFFENQCKSAGLVHKELLMDCPTRWNSTLVMLRRLLEMRHPFLSTCKSVKPIKNLKLHEDNELWERARLMIKMLEPFEKSTLRLSQDYTPTLSDVSSIYSYIFIHLETYLGTTHAKLQTTPVLQPSQPTWLVKAARKGFEKMSKYYDYCDNTVNVVATVMDPRYKMKWFISSWTEENWEPLEQKVNEVWDKYKQEIPIDSESPGIHSAYAHDEISCVVAARLKNHYKPDDELKRYLSEPLLPMSNGSNDALQWWKDHAVSYPLLSRMAMDFLAIPATGVPVERLFSTGPDVLKTKQQKMSAETIRKRIILKHWFKHSDGKFSLDIINDKAKSMIVEDETD